MEVRNAKQARQWLRAWNGRPRRGILQSAIDGMKACRGLTKDRKPRESKSYGEALLVLRTAWEKHYS